MKFMLERVYAYCRNLFFIKIQDPYHNLRPRPSPDQDESPGHLLINIAPYSRQLEAEAESRQSQVPSLLKMGTSLRLCQYLCTKSRPRPSSDRVQSPRTAKNHEQQIVPRHRLRWGDPESQDSLWQLPQAGLPTPLLRLQGMGSTGGDLRLL